MIKKPIIGIVGRFTTSLSGDNAICSWEEIRLSILKSGGIPLLILPTDNSVYEKDDNKHYLNRKEKADLYSLINICDGILFQGGLNWYDFDVVAFKYALIKDIPILGICAGMQMMACVDKYDVVKDMTTLNDTYINHKQKGKKYVHKVNVVKNTLLYNIVKTNTLNVNSRHNYHIKDTNKFVVSAYSEDGLIEAIEYPNKKFVLGIQWHPESMFYYDKCEILIFKKFIKICQKSSLFY